MKIFLHIGSGKCASSSIQQHFSYNPIQNSFAYGTIIPATGEILIGDKVIEDAKQRFTDYSFSFGNSFANPDNLKKSLAKCAEKFDTLLLSSESWLRQYEDFENNKEIFEPYEVEIIFIIRPFVEWYNSAWWQWYVWDCPMERLDLFIDKHTDLINNYANDKRISWAITYKQFSALDFVQKVHLLTLQKNIIEEIYSIMSIEYNELAKTVYNESLSAEILHFLLQYKNFRNVHSSPIDFILCRHLKKRTKASWVLSENNIRLILAKSKRASLELAEFVKNEDILANPKYWEVSAYKDKIAIYNRDIRLSEETMLDMLEEAKEVANTLENSLTNRKDYEANSLLQEINQQDNSNLSTSIQLLRMYFKIQMLDHDIRA